VTLGRRVVWTAAGTIPNGFTLFDLLVAIVLFGLLFVGLLHGTRFGLLAFTAHERLRQGTDDLSILDSTVRNLIENMDPGAGLGSAPISGSGEWLKFASTLQQASTRLLPGQRVTAELRLDGDHRIILRWRPLSHAARQWPLPAPTDTELLRGVSRIAFSYWRGGGTWVSEWQEPELPALVRIRLEFPEGDTRRWPDIVAAPGLDRQ
jgi:general secretion pathway protein J